MLNSVILVGRLVETPSLRQFEESNYSVLTLAVTRPFKNLNGEYDTDFIRCIAWDAIAKSSSEYCRKGDVIAIRGRLTTKHNEVSFNKDGEVLKKKVRSVEVIAERVVFVATSGTKNIEEDEKILSEQ